MIVWGRVTVPSHRLTLYVMLLIKRFFIAHRKIGSAKGEISTIFLSASCISHFC
jgi:hypothetical protein